ncbi:MAG: metallophosphoesterase [Armatimonadetes bacterium]|nr:metallophosphoesterase [Armatimonadota bacterium]
MTTVSGVTAVAAFAYAILIEQFSIRIRYIELAFPNLPHAFDGITILHLSDLHLTKLGTLERRLMDLISRREVDMCFITGDITQKPRASDIFRRICSVIKGPKTIYAVLGNSEHKPWLTTKVLVEALSHEGMRLLVNSSDLVCLGCESIRVVGVDDAFSRYADVDAAFEGVNPEEFIIFLTHCPSMAPLGVERGADLILAGHTHGGQVRLPFIGPIWSHMRSNKHLNDGLYVYQTSGFSRVSRLGYANSEALSSHSFDQRKELEFSDIQSPVLFVNRGVGTSKLHVRFLCSPEIAYITLRRVRS